MWDSAIYGVTHDIELSFAIISLYLFWYMVQGCATIFCCMVVTGQENIREDTTFLIYFKNIYRPGLRLTMEK